MALAVPQRERSLPGRVAPFVTSLLFVLVSIVPLQIPGFAAVMPSFALMAVFHWTCYRPDLLPMSMVFLLGLIFDLLNGTPYLGTSALILLLARAAVLTWRKHLVDRDFALLWLGFLGLAAGSFALAWGFVSLLQWRILAPRDFIFEAVLTVACFPVGSYVLARLHRAFLTA